ncbi:NYN domain-containing protein [Patescibacteria group bacterium]|nr:NYN domain-containing protein [Patescibacteria group bacterium]
MHPLSVKRKDQRVGIFVDIQNLYHSAKNLYHARVNYKELMKELVADRNLVGAYAYVVKSETAEGEAAFFDALEKAGLQLRSKDLQIFAGGQKKADWDVGMAVDAIRMCEPLDVVILVTGDGDFIPLVEYLRVGKGKTVEVAAFGRSASGKIKEVADEFIDIEKLPRVILRTQRRHYRDRQQKEPQDN